MCKCPQKRNNFVTRPPLPSTKLNHGSIVYKQWNLQTIDKFHCIPPIFVWMSFMYGRSLMLFLSFASMFLNNFLQLLQDFLQHLLYLSMFFIVIFIIILLCF